MAMQATTARSDPLSSGLAQYRLDDPREIERHLQELVEMQTPLHLSLRDGRNLRAKVTALDAFRRSVVLAPDESLEGLPVMRHDDSLSCVAYPGSVKLLFELTQLQPVASGSQSALPTKDYQAALPSHLFRIQRRESYRVQTIERDNSVARMTLPKHPGSLLVLKVHDISITGCALIAPPGAHHFEAGQRIANVEFELNADTHVRATIYVHHVLPQAQGAKMGCSLMNVDGTSERALQRYIFDTQKRRRWSTAII